MSLPSLHPNAARGLTTTYLILPPHEVTCGGAEKRLVGMWLHVARQRRADLRLVIHRDFYPNLRRVEEFHDLDAHRDQVVLLDPGDAPRRALWSWIAVRALAEPRAVFHFAMLPPGSFPVPASRLCFTLAAASLEFFSWKGKLSIYGGVARSSRVDCLDADVARELGRVLPWKKDRIHVTPGSFVDLTHFRPEPFHKKQNRLIFVGTFLDRKQTFRLLEQLPEIHARLLAAGIEDPEYVFLGQDPERRGVKETGERYGREHGMRVHVEYVMSTSAFLKTSKVHFAVQYLENYPSKALLEAMACGALPIVTDVGKSREVAKPGFAWFVQRDFTAGEIADAAIEILRLERGAFEAKVAEARAFIAQRFGVEAMVRYYLDLYERIAAER